MSAELCTIDIRRQRAGLGPPCDDGTLDAGLVHHGAHVVDAGLDRARTERSVGQTGAARVEDGDAEMGAEAESSTHPDAA